MTKIITDPKIMLGKPIIAGTRITVELVLNLIEHGMTINQITDEYDLTPEQVKSAIAYAKQEVNVKYPPQTATAHEIFARRKH